MRSAGSEEFKPDYLLFTKLDETESFGAIISTAIEAAKPLSFFANGQSIPEDLEAANLEALLRAPVHTRAGRRDFGGLNRFKRNHERGLFTHKFRRPMNENA